jgi:hypothetical protein
MMIRVSLPITVIPGRRKAARPEPKNTGLPSRERRCGDVNGLVFLLGWTAPDGIERARL